MENRTEEVIVEGCASPPPMGNLAQSAAVNVYACVSCLPYLFRREDPQSASIFTDCNTHLCKQGLPVVKERHFSLWQLFYIHIYTHTILSMYSTFIFQQSAFVLIRERG